MKEKRTFTENQKTDFKVWLVKNHTNIKEFAQKCGVSYQYIQKVINGKTNITNGVIATFEKGGYHIKGGKE